MFVGLTKLLKAVSWLTALFLLFVTLKIIKDLNNEQTNTELTESTKRTTKQTLIWKHEPKLTTKLGSATSESDVLTRVHWPTNSVSSKVLVAQDKDGHLASTFHRQIPMAKPHGETSKVYFFSAMKDRKMQYWTRRAAFRFLNGFVTVPLHLLTEDEWM